MWRCTHLHWVVNAHVDKVGLLQLEEHLEVDLVRLEGVCMLGKAEMSEPRVHLVRACGAGAVGVATGNGGGRGGLVGVGHMRHEERRRQRPLRGVGCEARCGAVLGGELLELMHAGAVDVEGPQIIIEISEGAAAKEEEDTPDGGGRVTPTGRGPFVRHARERPDALG